MELLIAIGLGLVAGTVLLMLGIPERLTQAMIHTATAGLPDPLRVRVSEECRSEIGDTKNAFGKVYIAASCFLDAARLRRLWRRERLHRLAKENTLAMGDDRNRALMRTTGDWDDLFSQKVAPLNAPVPLSRVSSTDQASIPWKARLALFLKPRYREPRYRASQTIFKSCGGKVFRLEGGIWTADW